VRGQGVGRLGNAIFLLGAPRLEALGSPCASLSKEVNFEREAQSKRKQRASVTGIAKQDSFLRFCLASVANGGSCTDTHFIAFLVAYLTIFAPDAFPCINIC
jgi:hypothetical protein